MRPLSVVEAQIPTDRCAGLADRAIGAEVNLLLILHRAPQALDHDIVAPRPLPSMLMAIFSRSNALVKAMLVNWLP